MANPGRKLDDISKFFHRDASLRPNVKATFKGCGKVMQCMPERLKTHVKGCGKAKKLFPGLEADLEPTVSTSSSSSQPFSPASPAVQLPPASTEGQSPPKKPFLFQARLPVSSTDKQLQYMPAFIFACFPSFVHFFCRFAVSLLPPIPLSRWWHAGRAKAHYLHNHPACEPEDTSVLATASAVDPFRVGG